jgi:hypothetical protein
MDLLARLGRRHKVITAYADIVARFSSANEPALKAIVENAKVLRRAKRFPEIKQWPVEGAEAPIIHAAAQSFEAAEIFNLAEIRSQRAATGIVPVLRTMYAGIETPWRAAEGTKTTTAAKEVNNAKDIDKILDRWLAAKGVTEDQRPSYIAKFNQMVVVRPKWADRKKFERLRHLSAPRFLRAVYADVIDTDGRLTNEEVVRLSDPGLVRIVQGYITKRVERRLSLGDAEGLIFTQKDNRGRPKKPRARKHHHRTSALG